MAQQVVSSAEVRNFFRQKVIAENKAGLVIVFLSHIALGLLITLHVGNPWLLAFFVVTEIYAIIIGLYPRKATELFENIMPVSYTHLTLPTTSRV